jgi:hypothetical protein
MSDDNAWPPSEGGYPNTGASVDDVPLNGEEIDTPLFPESTYDDDTMAHRRARVHQNEQAEESRQYLREKRRRALLDRVVMFITRRRLLPKSWLHITPESGERYPAFICSIRDNGKRWAGSTMAAVSFVASVLWIVQWLLGAPSVVMHDGTNVVNLWAPRTIYKHDLTSEKVSAWLVAHRKEVTVLRQRDVRSEYFEAHIYQPDERRNVTFEWLDNALVTTCTREDGCACMPALELGILANVVLVGDTVMFNPRITKQSDKRIAVTYDDGTRATQPAAIVVEYMHRDGKMHRRMDELDAAFCLTRSLDLLGVTLNE